jgi:hypothetical protein
MTLPELFLFCVGFILLVWLATTLIRRKLYKQYPFFFVFLVLEILLTAALFAVYHKRAIYFWVYWIGDLIDTIIALIAIYEVFRQVFHLFYGFFWWFRLLFPGLIAILCMICIQFAILAPPVQAFPVTEVFLAYFATANTVFVGLVSLFIVLLVLLGLHCRNDAFGILRGFIVTAFGSLFCVGLRYQFGNKCSPFLKFGPGLAFICGTILWLKAFLQPPEHDVVEPWAAPVGRPGSRVNPHIRRLLQTQ